MKTSNLKFTMALAYIMLTLVLITFIAAFFIKHEGYDFILFTIAMIITVAFLNLKFIFLELSGGYISMRKSHPFRFKRFLSPTFELPLSFVKNYKLVGAFGVRILELELNPADGKRVMLQIIMIGFTGSQRKKIHNKLQSVVERNQINAGELNTHLQEFQRLASI